MQGKLPTLHPYYNNPPITTISNFQPDQIKNLDVWNDANDLIKYGYQDTAVLPNWNNRANTKWYADHNNTNVVFNRWGLNGLPTVRYNPTTSANIQDISGNNYSVSNPTFMAISRISSSNPNFVFTNTGHTTFIGYDSVYKNILKINNVDIVDSTDPMTIPINDDWDNYTLTGNLDGHINVSNTNL